MDGYRRFISSGLALAAIVSTAAPAGARAAIDDALAGVDMGSAIKGPDYLECVPYARRLSGIQIFGDAHTWWDKAKGRYATGKRPRVGAVMAIPAYANSHLGHVATVSKVVDSRTILISHANWSPIDGQRGQIENNVTALDVSPGNDWSEVRIWYAPIRSLGTTHWPVEGFIYNARPGNAPENAPPRLETASAANLAAAPATRVRKTGRRSDPIGNIIAGTYR